MESTLHLHSFATDLSCSQCEEHYRLDSLQYFSPCCEKPLVVNYAVRNLEKQALVGRGNSMWRYAEMLPLVDYRNQVSLGEGMTPIFQIRRYAQKYGFEQLFVKDEGLNPTGSFKSRGLSMAISKAKEFGIKECVIPTAGNAGGAMSAYCAAAGMKATVIMPKHTPKPFQDECLLFGAELKLIDGLIDRCGEVASAIQKETGAFNMSTLKEPYRLEGKKTMGYEIAEQMKWELPDVIVYPTGGGTGLIGIWKAFQEMISLGWIDGTHLPKMVVVQSLNCAPMVHYVNGNEAHESYGESKANGLAVPVAFGKDLIKKVVQESNGSAIAVSEESILRTALELSRSEGISFSPEGGATMAGLLELAALGVISKKDKILIINTGNASKYMDHFQ